MTRIPHWHPSSETHCQGLLVGTMRYFWASNIFGKSLFKELKSPWALIITEPVPEVVDFCPAEWSEKMFFCPISNEV